MGEKIVIYESDYLVFELMSNANTDFVIEEFNHIEELIKEESQWEMIPEWLEYLSNRPVGNKPYKSNLNIYEFCDFLQRNNLKKIEQVEVEADERGIFASEIISSEIYANSTYAIVFSAQNDAIENICVVPLVQDDFQITDVFKNSIKFILDKYNLIFVDWNNRKLN